MAQMLMAYYIT